MRQQVKRVVAIIMTVAMLVGLFPLEVFAQNSQRAADTQTLTASVDYDSAERATATVTYHKEAQTAPACNIVFLLDASRQGGSATAQFKNMIGDNVWSLISGTRASMQVISYTQTPVLRENTNGSVVGGADGLNGLVAGIATGDGTADEAAALEKAVGTVNDINNENPTIVFWVLGDHFGNEDTDAVEDALQSLDDALGANDALIAWQLADEPNDLIADHATSYTTAENENTSAAYADNDAETFRSGMRDSLERVLHDHYRNASVTLSLANDQSLATKITDAEWKPANENILPKVTTEVATDGKSVTVNFDKLCDQISGDLVLTLDLDTSKNEKQTVLAAATAEGSAPEKITAMPGQYVTLPDEGSLTNSGSSFGGWNDEEGNYYSAGQIIAMPAENLALTPAWGHVEVELELGDVRYAEANGNQMASNAKAGGLLSFVGQQTKDGQTIAKDSIHSLQVIDQDLNYESVAGSSDQNQVNITTEDIEAVYARHVGATNDDRVVAYLRKCQCEQKKENKYDLVIAGPGGVVAPEDMSNWLDGANGDNWTQNVEKIDLSALDTRATKYMKRIFWGCQSITELDVSMLDVSNVTNMEEMFSTCTKMETLTLGDNFDSSNATSMWGMFAECYALKDLDVSNLDFSKDTGGVWAMFRSCQSLERLTFGGADKFDTPIQTVEMFLGCSNLKTIELGGLADVMAGDCHAMFQNCTSLTSINGLDQVDTSEITWMSKMFAGCSSLESLDLSNFDTAKVTEMEYMFNGCSSLTSLALSEKFNTSTVTTMAHMFNGCSSLTSLELPTNFDTSSVTNMQQMFNGDSSLTSIDLGEKFHVRNVTDLSAMFSGCSNLATINGNLIFASGEGEENQNKATTMASMFNQCSALTRVPFTYEGEIVQFPALTTMASMFSGCAGLPSINMSGWQMQDLTNTSSMFNGCSLLGTLDLSWTGINAIQDDLKVDGMFNSVPTDAMLTIIEEGNGDLSTFMQAVVDAFESVDGRTVTINDASSDTDSGDNTASGDATNALPPTEPEPSPTPQPEKPSDGSTNDNTSDESTSDDPTKNDATTGGDASSSTAPGGETMTDDPEQDATEPAADAVSPLALSRSGSTPVVQADDGEKNYTVNGNIWTHKQATPAGSEFQYRVRVKYVGDVGAQSGEIKVTFPIPDDVRVLTDAELKAIGAETKLVQAGSVKGTEGADSGDFMGGRVVDAKYDSATETLTATIDGLFTGTEVEISIWCENETKLFPQGGYVYWDGTATAQDSAALVSSNIYRLWDQRGAGENPPPKKEYTLTYQFAGEVPPDASTLLPQQKTYASGTQATVADVQESSYGYYEFMGWKDQDGTSYTAGDSITMKKDITLTGTWKLKENEAPTITVAYAYSGDVPDGAPSIGEDGQIQSPQQITVGKTHTVVANLLDVDYSSFNGWVPSLSVGGSPVEITDKFTPAPTTAFQPRARFQRRSSQMRMMSPSPTPAAGRRTLARSNLMLTVARGLWMI